MATYGKLIKSKTLKEKSTGLELEENKKKLLQEIYDNTMAIEEDITNEKLRFHSKTEMIKKLYNDIYSPNSLTKIQNGQVINVHYNPDTEATIAITKTAVISDACAKLTKALDGWTGEEANAFVALRNAGWEIQVNPAIAYGDRKGYQ